MDTLVKKTELNSEFILNSLQSPIIVINSIKKTIIYCNNSTEIFLEMSGKNIVGKKINSLFKDDSYFISLIVKTKSKNIENSDKDDLFSKLFKKVLLNMEK